MTRNGNIKKSRLLRRILGVALLISVLLGVLSLGIVLYVRHSTGARIVLPDALTGQTFDCILVLGAGVRDDGSPSHMLADRLETALPLYEAGVSSRLLMSGDHGRKDYDEVNTMRDYAMARGVPSEVIFLDHAGFSTYESLYRARDIFGARRIVIVTQGYHLPRALYIADTMGLDAYGVAADRAIYAGQFFRDVREAAAQVKDFASCILAPKPTYLGEAIPLSGQADATWG